MKVESEGEIFTCTGGFKTGHVEESQQLEPAFVIASHVLL